MTEIWKDIKGYEGKYQISNLGNIKSFSKGKEHLLKPYLTKGYLSIGLWNGQKKQTVLIHRLVALAFIPNPNGYKEINHKDENKLNNNVDNLEWCSASYNCSYGSKNHNQTIKLGKKVLCIELNQEFPSFGEAGRILNIPYQNISKCCKNKLKTAGGYHWKLLT